jgi:hypothetical protein
VVTFADVYWTLWLLIGFGVYETYAVATNQPQKTFTHFYCRAFALFPGDKGTAAWWRFRRFLGVAIASWLVLHVLTMTAGGLF